MLVALQLVGVAGAPLNVTVLVPCVPPKFTPAIVTDVPAGPVPGLRLVMYGTTTPAPVSEMATGTVFALLVTLIVPVLGPAAVGEKVTLAVQLVPGARGDEAPQLSVSAKSPLALTPKMLIVAVLAFFKFNCCEALLVPVACAGKTTELGEAISSGLRTWTGTVTWRLWPPCVYVALTAALPGLTAVIPPRASIPTTELFDDTCDKRVDSVTSATLPSENVASMTSPVCSPRLSMTTSDTNVDRETGKSDRSMSI